MSMNHSIFDSSKPIATRNLRVYVVVNKLIEKSHSVEKIRFCEKKKCFCSKKKSFFCHKNVLFSTEYDFSMSVPIDD